jgi:beta-glucuronidase
MQFLFSASLLGQLLLVGGIASQAQSLLTDIPGRSKITLDGAWETIVDANDAGTNGWKPIWKDQRPTGKSDFYEYEFNPSRTLQVPGDWNSQQRELTYYEGTIWYNKKFRFVKRAHLREFLYFSAVNYECEVYVNHRKIGGHEGGFTPFQFEVTDQLIDGDNSIIVRVNNSRRANGIPARNFDWWNYGGITRDVYIVETPDAHIQDYFIQLAKANSRLIRGWVLLAGAGKPVADISIPELGIHFEAGAKEGDTAFFEIPARPNLWSPENPKLYQVVVTTSTDTLRESIGFRNIAVSGTDILLNGHPIFLRGVNIHEEIPQRASRAWSEADARQLLNWAKELGCNFVRLTHYPHNEYMVRLADELGILLWEEIPLWQEIEFGNPAVIHMANNMLREMIGRDKNRCAIILWSLSNETSPSALRNQALIELAAQGRKWDSTRLFTSAFNHLKSEGNVMTINDPVGEALDVLAVNEYLGWYVPWPPDLEPVIWKSIYQKPLIMSEFGGEALYGVHGPADSLSSWSEESQEAIYRKQVAMFKQIPFLRGTAPWILADFRSPLRMHPIYQNGWNRKGLLGNNGLRKKAWYVMYQYYRELVVPK